MTVITNTVKHGLCIGCGLCAALCPQGVLAMQWNRYGEYNPVEVSPCTTACGLCLKVCPFADSEENEDTIGERLYGSVPGIQHRSETGYYLASYVGYSENHRPSSASGGMATWLLEALLREGIVDHIICVTPTGDPERLFAFQVFDTPEEVRTGAGSAYYPVEMSGVIQRVVEVPGRYAITGLPCFIKAIRLAQQKNRVLRERIQVVVGLTCGQLKSKHYAAYLVALAGLEDMPTKAFFRGKDPKQPAGNYYFSCVDKEETERRIFLNNGVSEVWENRWFTLNACNYCDDVFAECADATFMDAWLPKYSHDTHGTSLLIIRSRNVWELVEQGRSYRTLSLDNIGITHIIQSQKSVTQSKSRDLAYRLYKWGKLQVNLPRKRVQPNDSLDPLSRWELNIINTMQKRSKEFIPDHYFSSDDITGCKKALYWESMKIRFIKFLNLPSRVVSYVTRRI